jgi:hypothetical protein
MTNSKTCPLMSKELFLKAKQIDCTEHKCRWWTYAYTTENLKVWDCCEVLKAHLNSEGKYVV